MKFKLKTLLSFLIAGICCAGQISCSSIPRGEAPKVSLVDIKFSDITVFETSAEFTVRIENPNPFDVELSGAKYLLYINGREIGQGLSDQSITIPHLSSATQRVIARIGNISLVRNIESLIDQRHFQYKIESTLYLPGIFGLSKYKVESIGQYPGF